MSTNGSQTEALRARILTAMQRDMGISTTMVEPFVNSVMKCFAGEQPYFPHPKRAYPVEQIKMALEDGAAVSQILKKYDLSRFKLYSLSPEDYPGGDGALSGLILRALFRASTLPVDA
ncbi:Mor family transcriptional regulator [Xanthomonas sp. F14]